MDGEKSFKDEGICPLNFGSYHLYHRIDDVLVAVNVIDITKWTLKSLFCFYDPNYKSLSLGHVTAIREIEFMLMLWDNFNTEM